jgi:hypothetical protein
MRNGYTYLGINRILDLDVAAKLHYWGSKNISC